MLHILNFRMLRAFWENFGENSRRERPKIVRSRSRKTRMKPSKIGNPLPKSQLDFESFSLRPLRYISKINLIQYSKKAGCRQHFSPCAVQRRGAAARIVSTQFKAALHKNAGRCTKSCATACGRVSKVRGQRLHWVPVPRRSRQPSSVMAFSYSSLEISQVRDISEFSRTGMNLKITVSPSSSFSGKPMAASWTLVDFFFWS